MHNEKQNDPLNWISKLDEPGCLPAEEMIDKNAAWKKLHERLRDKPQKNKMIWYWAAAACLLITVSFSILISKKNEHHLVKNVSGQNKKQPQSIAHSSSMPEKTNIQVENTSAIKKKQDNHFISKHINNNPPADHALTKPLFADAGIDSTKATVQQLPVNIFTPTDTVLSIIAASVPVKKKMRVVHINELENAADGMASSTADHQQSSLSMPFGNNIQTSKNSSSAARDYAGVFKIKISSKN